jgi:hypothetical protein
MRNLCVQRLTYLGRAVDLGSGLTLALRVAVLAIKAACIVLTEWRAPSDQMSVKRAKGRNVSSVIMVLCFAMGTVNACVGFQVSRLTASESVRMVAKTVQVQIQQTALNVVLGTTCLKKGPVNSVSSLAM